MEVKKMFYTMGEVAEMFDVNSSLIRYWEGQFNIIKPVRNKKGNRLFTPKDVENFKTIYHLVKVRGMTLEGAKKSLRKGASYMSKEVELMDRLLNMRSLLLEVREVLKEDDAEEPEVQSAMNHDVAESMPQQLQQLQQSQERLQEESQEESQEGANPSASSLTSAEVSKEKELFAFYEQNLF